LAGGGRWPLVLDFERADAASALVIAMDVRSERPAVDGGITGREVCGRRELKWDCSTVGPQTIWRMGFTRENHKCKKPKDTRNDKSCCTWSFLFVSALWMVSSEHVCFSLFMSTKQSVSALGDTKLKGKPAAKVVAL